MLIVVNDPAFFLSHRLPVALGARKAGWDVHLATGPGPEADAIRQLGFPHHAFPVDRGGMRPARDLATLRALYRLFRRLRPDLVHTVTIKPVIWGGIAARLAGVPARLSAVPGLGYIYIAGGTRGRAVRSLVGRLYRMALGGSGQCILFQNRFDRAQIARFGVTVEGRSQVIRGSGVSLDDFPVRPEPPGPPVVLMAARMLRYKGPAEFVEAARLLRARGVEARFRYAGEPDAGNPDSVTPDQLARWRAEGAVEFLGRRTDMARVLAETHVVVLPSRSEGVPKVLLEAAATGRAVVTCDAPGCRDAIAPDVTGLLVPPGDPPALADALAALIGDPTRRKEMGRQGRLLAEAEFDVAAVVAAHLAIYDRLLPRNC